MQSAFTQGFILGLTLSILAGPILFTLVQTSLERGARAGIFVGLGVWLSDFIFITLTWLTLSQIQGLENDLLFKSVTGLIGGILLVGIGIGFIVKKSKEWNANSSRSSVKGYLGYWTLGFAINTFNPFTFFFWITVMSTIVLTNSWSLAEAIVFFGGIMGVVIITDILKVLLAKRLRKYLTPQHIMTIRKICGSALILFGVVLIIRTVL